MSIFYVYEHWRPDKDVCFWVGKGKDRRAYSFVRNSYYNRVVAKLARLGMCVEVRMVDSGLSEDDALKLEKERIAFWKQYVVLCNQTEGGEGVSNPSPEVRSKIGNGMRGKKHSPETKIKFREAQIRRFKDPLERIRCITPAEIRKLNPILQKGRVVTDEFRTKIGNIKRGCKMPTEAKAKISASLKGRPVSEETRKKLAAQAGWKHSEEAKAKMRAAKRRTLDEVK